MLVQKVTKNTLKGLRPLRILKSWFRDATRGKDWISGAGAVGRWQWYLPTAGIGTLGSGVRVVNHLGGDF